jgi:lipoate-protein ligase A
MGERWRFIDAGPMEAPVAFGRMPSLASGVASAGPPVLMTSVWARAHFQIGWFEDVDAVLDLDAARDLGVDVFRRPLWGGGAAFYDTEATALFSWFVYPDRFPTLDQALQHFRPAMERALGDLGLGEARLEGSSDIRWQGRKLGTVITQTVLGTKVVGGFLNLKRPDVELYRKVARVPAEKFQDKSIKDQVLYICTPADVRGRDLPYGEFRDAVARASREVTRLELEPSPFTPEEEAGTAGFVEVVSADDWVRRVSSVRFAEQAPSGARVGFANWKAKKLVRAGVALGGDGAILAAMMAGDMHVSPPDAMDRVAAAVVGGSPDDRQDVVARVRSVFEQPDVDQPDQAAGISAEDCAEAVIRAAKSAA